MAPTQSQDIDDVRADRERAGEQLGRSFKSALAALRRMRSRESQRHELSDAQYGVLLCLCKGGELPAGEIAVAADVSPASATEMLEWLEQSGLVQRTRSERDRRVVLSSLTERGRELVERRRARMEPVFRATMERFSTEELRTAAAVLDGMREVFDALAEERAEHQQP